MSPKEPKVKDYRKIKKPNLALEGEKIRKLAGSRCRSCSCAHSNVCQEIGITGRACARISYGGMKVDSKS